ncbi:MAG: Hsp20/alpha crystallin family protein [Pseudobdellovibrionaceae bacterium]
MEKFFFNRIVLVLVAFFAGGASVWGVTKFLERKKASEEAPQSLLSLRQNPDKFFPDFFNDDFFGSSRDLVEEIKQRKDDNFLYYEIDLHGQSPKEVKVEVKNGQIFISGQIESKEDKDGSSSYYSSSFQRSFPVPSDVDSDNFKTEQDDKKIIIKFPKLKTGTV